LIGADGSARRTVEKRITAIDNSRGTRVSMSDSDLSQKL
jgi:hypothetical protein